MKASRLFRIFTAFAMILSLVVAPNMFGYPLGHVAHADSEVERVLVKFRPSVGESQRNEIHAHVGAAHVSSISGIDVEVVTVPWGKSAAAVKAYQLNPKVQFAEVD